MARFQHTVTLLPVPRRWFESCVVVIHWDRHRGTSVDITVRGNDPAGSEPPLSCRLDLKTAERRSIGRLLLPVVMTVAGRRARTSFVRALDDAARKWNGRIPELVRCDPSRLVDGVF